MNRETGARIREARKAAGLSQEKLAKAVEGLSASVLSKAERGEKALSSEQLEAIARALGVPSETLLADVEAENVSASSPATLTPEEQELLAAYRAANAETKKVAVSALRGENAHTPNIMDMFAGMMNGNGGGNPLADMMRRGESGENPMAGMIGKLMDVMGGKSN